MSKLFTLLIEYLVGALALLLYSNKVAMYNSITLALVYDVAVWLCCPICTDDLHKMMFLSKKSC